MTKQEAVQYFGSQYALAKAINRHLPQVMKWPDDELTKHNTALVQKAIRKAEKAKEQSK